MDARAQAETAVPLSPRPYDGTPMGTLPAQRGRGDARFGLQDGGSRRDRTQTKDARPDGDFSLGVYRRFCEKETGWEPWACKSCDCTERLGTEARELTAGEGISFIQADDTPYRPCIPLHSHP